MRPVYFVNHAQLVQGEGDSIPLKTITQQRQESIQRTISERNGHFFEGRRQQARRLGRGHKASR